MGDGGDDDDYHYMKMMMGRRRGTTRIAIRIKAMVAVRMLVTMRG